MSKSRAPLGMVLGLALLSGCTTLPERLGMEQAAPEACLATYQAVDGLVEARGQVDAGSHQPADFPWLRSTRFLASFADELEQDEERWHSWLSAMVHEDLLARRHELANALAAETGDEGVESRLAELKHCAKTLNSWLMTQPDARERLRRQAAVPDDYHTSRRWLGLYPISRLFVLSGVRNLHQDQAQALEATPTLASDARWRQYLAEGKADAPSSPITPDAMDRDALAIPRPTADQRASLFARHAPIWRMEELTTSDQLGQPRLGAERHAVVDTEAPAEFRFLSYTRFEDEIILQLNYMVWLPERPRDGFLDLLGGHLDGAIWRVNLRPDGTVLAAESLHNCGCYYMVFPGPGVRPRSDQPGGEPIFVGPALPMPDAGERIRLTRASGSHYLVDVDTAPIQADIRLPIRQAQELQSLSGHGRHSSLYDAKGLVPGSERRERWLLWTMGVASPGAMRQPGRHAIAFAGRRHFDDARLLESSLVGDDGEAIPVDVSH